MELAFVMSESYAGRQKQIHRGQVVHAGMNLLKYDPKSDFRLIFLQSKVC